MGSSPIRVAIFGSVAQLVEQWTENPRVTGSIPVGATICGFSSSGRAPPCQGGGSEFEPRNPLQTNPLLPVKAREGFFFLYLKIPTNRCFICGLKSAAQLRDNRGIAKSKVAVLAFAAVFLFLALYFFSCYYICTESDYSSGNAPIEKSVGSYTFTGYPTN